MTTDTTPGAAGIAEAARRFGEDRFAGLTPIDLTEGNDGFEGLAAADRRFTNRYPAQRTL